MKRIAIDKQQAELAQSYGEHRVLLLAILPLLFALSSISGYAQRTPSGTTRTHGQKTITAVRTELPVTLDGNLDEPAWQAAQISLGFVQKDPLEGEPSSERTEFRVLYTATTLYIGVVCYDSNVEGILATDRRRDSAMENDDKLSIVLDTFHDHRNAFLFRTNPLGAQYDALITDEGNSVNENWDEKWDVASQISPVGWTAEFAIPFKSLRVSEEDGQSWGLDLERVIRRKNEFSYWNSFHRGFDLENISQGGHLEGLENIETGLRLRIKPYLLGGFVNERRVNPMPGATDPFRSTTRNASDVGIEVLKYRITPSLTADVTWRTDFAQTEVDNQQVSLERFPLFFPEKREFFQEGAGIFDFGRANQEGRRVLRLFHSRRIGLVRGQPVPIIAGGRITGKTRGFTVGILNMQTETVPSEDIPASNYSVLRLKRDVLSRSTVGAFMTNREMGGSSDFSRVYGMDGNFVFYNYLTIDGFLAKSAELENVKDNWVAKASAIWDSDLLTVGMEYLEIGPNFRNDVGFIRRTDLRRYTPTFEISPRPDIPGVRQIALRARLDYTVHQQDTEVQEKVGHYILEISFQNGGVFGWSPHVRFDRLKDPFEIRPGVIIPPGTYSWWNNGLRYRTNPARRISGSVNWSRHFDYYKDGKLDNVRINASLRLSEQFSVSTGYSINKASFPQRDFTDHLINTRINYNFNNQWLTSTIIQYNNTDSFFGVNFRLNYIFRPGDDFFLVYNDGRRALFDDIDNVERAVTGVFDGQRDRSLLLKLTYSFDL
ncbi:MAG: DUF5916 domain-containing protein [Acidobacteria bacterium]|nr:DUF5916 domain-containing protein [Acidobacteriota bacterium]